MVYAAVTVNLGLAFGLVAGTSGQWQADRAVIHLAACTTQGNVEICTDQSYQTDNTPGFYQSDIDTSGVDRSGIDKSGFDQTDIDTSGNDQSGIDTSGFDQSDIDGRTDASNIDVRIDEPSIDTQNKQSSFGQTDTGTLGDQSDIDASGTVRVWRNGEETSYDVVSPEGD